MNYTKLFLRQLMLLSVALVFLISSCQDDDSVIIKDDQLASQEDASVPLAWMNLFLEIDRYAQNYRPGPCPRALAYINMAAYESCMKGMPDFKSLGHLYPGLVVPETEKYQKYHLPTVANAVYATLIKRFFPGDVMMPAQQTDLQFKIFKLENEFYDKFAAEVGNSNIVESSRAYGEAVANAFWEWSKTDAFGHEAFKNPRPASYEPPLGPGLWQPTPPDYSKALYPYWGNVRTFAISSAEKLSKPPLAFSETDSSEFYKQALDTKNAVTYLNFNEQWVAEFWSDDFVVTMFSPPSRWISITTR